MARILKFLKAHCKYGFLSSFEMNERDELVYFTCGHARASAVLSVLGKSIRVFSFRNFEQGY